MFKYLLLKVIYDISDVDVVDRSRYVCHLNTFLGMAPEEDVINRSSVIASARQLPPKDMDLMNLLIKKTVDIAIEKGTHQVKDDNRGCHPYRLTFQSLFSFRDSSACAPGNSGRPSMMPMRGMKDTLPKKNEDEDLVHELDYTRELLDIISDHSCITEVPAVKQRLNLLQKDPYRYRGSLYDVQG